MVGRILNVVVPLFAFGSIWWGCWKVWGEVAWVVLGAVILIDLNIPDQIKGEPKK